MNKKIIINESLRMDYSALYDNKIIFSILDNCFYIYDDQKDLKRLSFQDAEICLNEYLKLDIAHGEVKCDNCGGLSPLNGRYCHKCKNTGKLDWIEYINGKKNLVFGTSYGTSYDSL